MKATITISSVEKIVPEGTPTASPSTITYGQSTKTYWVFANITPSFDENGKVIGYYSVRRRPSKEGVETLKGIYQKLLEIEKEKGMEAGVQFVLDFLKQHQISWDELMINLQNKGKVGGYR